MTARISDSLLDAIKEIEEEEKADRAEVVRRLLDRSVKEWRLSRALGMASSGAWTTRRAAKYAGLRYHEFIDRLAEAGIDTGPSLKELMQ